MADESDVVSKLESLAGRTTDQDADKELEKLAFEVSQSPKDVARDAVRAAVKHIVRSKSAVSNSGLFLCWLLLYKVVEPFQVLQVVIFTKNASILRVCGTGEFEPDVLEHLKIARSDGLKPQFSLSADSERIFIDMIDEIRQNQEFKAQGRADPQPYERLEWPVKPSSERDLRDTQAQDSLSHKKSKPDIQAYEQRIRKIIMSSMSADETAHKILAIYIKNTAQNVANTLLKTCYEAKVYNRIYGNIALKLSRQNNSLWPGAWALCFKEFFNSGCEHVDADRLKVSGAFWGHLLSTNALSWNEAFTAVSLDMQSSTPSNRILFLAILEELKAAMGIKSVEAKIMSDPLRSAVDGVLNTELAAGFWDLAGYEKLAEISRERQES